MKIHLAECEPEGKGWEPSTFAEATGHGMVGDDAMCPAVAYMWDEMYPDEPVWVEHEEVAL